MLRKPVICLATLIGLVVAGAAAADDTKSSVRIGNATVAIEESSDETAAPLLRLAQVQRNVREVLLVAALTPDQMSEAFMRLGDFATSYAGAVAANDPVIQEFSYEELFARKAVPNLRRYGITDAEIANLSALVGTWTAEAINLPEDVLGSVGLEVRR